jgi:hypothetical protein
MNEVELGSQIRNMINEKERDLGILNQFFQKTIRDFYVGI